MLLSSWRMLSACSRELSREAMHLLEQHVYRPAQQLSYTMPPPETCPLATDQVLFLDHEAHKYRVHANRWKCGYCGKQFRGEPFVDQHMDAKHTAEDDHGLCLADFCGILNCPSARAQARHAKCSHNTVFRLRQQCKTLFQACFPYEAPSVNTMRRSEPASNVLFEYVRENVCEAITCEGSYDDDDDTSSPFFAGVIIVLKVLGMLTLVVACVLVLDRYGLPSVCDVSNVFRPVRTKRHRRH
ncbi:hypothetical protein SPRG_17701 [Saprolegnia parasitica CBS 223.65]|uniref:C2H2-type domain-containing protein n=1 Tax=Saprolegnia parasitica (strain CBS 223.65) TaxID=695850 RepID=A0A067BR77_SAPPC|nr:hypothetical protein SPRG_17701 [Saprolegnia parasitica CBS 223.65]KDO16816.1 hypothetical protein SPRG_17701 [Saprolegnia parasitica CBS 223.65]|eukprot:XP_012212476.1 hypothetical protein SPRG_17701 [Saprolegnia parasitica CBS 223.65]